MKPFYSNPLLSSKELQILPLLAQGIGYKEICKRLMIGPASRIHSHLHRIRVKTGIRDTHSQAECAAFMETFKPDTGKPTPQQTECLKMYINLAGYQEIADTFKMTKQAAMNHVCQGIKRLGVRGKGQHRRDQIRALLESYELIKPLWSPMSDEMFN